MYIRERNIVLILDKMQPEMSTLAHTKIITVLCENIALPSKVYYFSNISRSKYYV